MRCRSTPARLGNSVCLPYRGVNRWAGSVIEVWRAFCKAHSIRARSVMSILVPLLCIGLLVGCVWFGAMGRRFGGLARCPSFCRVGVRTTRALLGKLSTRCRGRGLGHFVHGKDFPRNLSCVGSSQHAVGGGDLTSLFTGRIFREIYDYSANFL